jgi:hypothetical protein
MVINDCSLLNEIAPVIRKIDGSFVVWFANGNQYLRLEEPAYFVFERSEEGLGRDLIAGQCAERYGTAESECRQFVAEILDGIETIRQTPVGKELDGKEKHGLQEKMFLPFSNHFYEINGKFLCFRFETRLYEHYLHPLLQHLETDACPTEPILFELFGYNGKIVLRVGHQVKGTWAEDETHLLNGMASLQLLNTIYEKEDHDWMAIIHASAVTNGTKTIVFTASPGSGKSTIAALLQQKGFPIVSDDFVPLEQITQLVFPFPMAMSVKEGATELLSTLYPSLQKQEEAQRSRTNKPVRYLPIEGKALPTPVKEVIFIKYDPSVDFEMEQLSGIEALKMLLDETWTSPSAQNAARFLDWYCCITCYRLTYSNNEKALKTITDLFEQ